MPEAAETAPESEGQGQTGQRTDPYAAYNFRLDIQGVEEARFTECSGIGMRVEALRYREGGRSASEHRLPGRPRYADVTLRYGLTSSRSLWDWFMSAVEGKVQRKNVSIVLLKRDGTTEATRWNLGRAWPSEWRGAPLDAMGHEVAVESLTLVYESLERV